MKLSVAMCTYNGARYLHEQLQSIAAQTRPPDELIVCDDCSSDQTKGIVEAFARTASFPVRLYVNEKNLRSTKNFERAIKLCSGELIALADQDDIWHPQKLKLSEAVLLARPEVGLVFTNGEVVDEKLKPLGWDVWQLVSFGKKEQKLFTDSRALDVLLDHNVVTGTTMVFRSRFKDLAVPFPTDLVHDGWTIIHDGWLALLIAATSRLAFLPEKLIQYRQHSQQQLGMRSILEADPESLTTESFTQSARRRNDFQTELHFIKSIAQRLTLSKESFPAPGAMPELNARITHLEARATLPPTRIGRLPSVLREIVTLRYHLYSNGMYSAAKDLLLGRL